MNLFEVAREISDRLGRIFLRAPDGSRAVFGSERKFQDDPHWRDYLLFYEYFHGENGAGIGASHQTGWTGLVAKEIELFRVLTAKDLLAGGRSAAFAPKASAPVPTLSYVTKGSKTSGGTPAAEPSTR